MGAFSCPCIRECVLHASHGCGVVWGTPQHCSAEGAKGQRQPQPSVPTGGGGRAKAELAANPPGEPAAPVLPHVRPRLLPPQAGQQQHPGAPRTGLLFFSKQYFPPSQGRNPALLQQLLPALGGCRQRECKHGAARGGCEAGAAAAPGWARVSGSQAAAGPRRRAAPVTCWPPARAGRKTRGEFVPQSCARSSCDALSLRPCAAQTPLDTKCPPPGTSCLLPLWEGCNSSDQECRDFSMSAASIAGGMGMLGAWRGGGCS